MQRFLLVLWTIARKELVHFWRNKRILQMILITQGFDIAVFGTMDFTVREVPTAIVDQDHTAESRQLIERITATKTFDVRKSTSSVSSAREDIRAGRQTVAIVIPPDYGRSQSAREAGRVLTIVDGTNASVTDAVHGAMLGIASKMNFEAEQELVETPPRTVLHAVLLFNPEGRTANYMLPGLLAILLADCYVLFGVFSVAGERANGNLERLLLTPMPPFAYILGKLAPWTGIGFANALVVLLVIHFGLGVPVRGDVLVLALATVLYLVTAVAFGLYLGLGREEIGETTSSYVSLAAYWLSGFIFPLSSLPKPLLFVSYLLPQTHYVEIMHGACLRGANVADLVRPLLCLGAAPLVLIVLATRRFVRTVGD